MRYYLHTHTQKNVCVYEKWQNKKCDCARKLFMHLHSIAHLVRFFKASNTTLTSLLHASPSNLSAITSNVFKSDGRNVNFSKDISFASTSSTKNFDYYFFNCSSTFSLITTLLSSMITPGGGINFHYNTITSHQQTTTKANQPNTRQHFHWNAVAFNFFFFFFLAVVGWGIHRRVLTDWLTQHKRWRVNKFAD